MAVLAGPFHPQGCAGQRQGLGAMIPTESGKPHSGPLGFLTKSAWRPTLSWTGSSCNSFPSVSNGSPSKGNPLPSDAITSRPKLGDRLG